MNKIIIFSAVLPKIKVTLFSFIAQLVSISPLIKYLPSTITKQLVVFSMLLRLIFFYYLVIIMCLCKYSLIFFVCVKIIKSSFDLSYTYFFNVFCQILFCLRRSLWQACLGILLLSATSNRVYSPFLSMITSTSNILLIMRIDRIAITNKYMYSKQH